ncbi:MAG: VPS10 domain-containing protein [Planctomycetota bacterium]
MMRTLAVTTAVAVAYSALAAQEPPAAADPSPAAPAAAAEAADAAGATAPKASPFVEALVADLRWRHLGPANPMGRMTDIAVHPARQSTWFVGTAGGGLWQTDNAGTTWSCVSARLGSVSIGDVAIAPSNPDIVWIGTGEENARNSVQWGDGVYKSTDGGASWTHMGLRATFQIGHVEIHPTNPDIVYVAALGRLWGDNPERGVFRSKDGGQTWEHVLGLDARTGCIDVRVHPGDPDTVFACMYERKRDGFDGNDPSVRFGGKSGLYKSIDGGENWRQLTTGLPTCTWGRSGIDLLASRPDTMFAIIETERSGWAKGDRKDLLPGEGQPDRGGGRGGDEGETPNPAAQQEEGEPSRGQAGGGRAPTPPQAAAAAGPRAGGRARRGAELGVGSDGGDGPADAPGAILRAISEGGPAAKAGLQAGDRVTKVGDEAVKTYADLAEIVRDAAPGAKATLTFVRGTETRTAEVTYGERQAGAFQQAAGRPNGPYSGRLFGQDANKQKEQGELGFQCGGVYRSDDRGENWRRVNSLTERPFYYSVLRVDPRSDQNVYCVGTTLWGTRDGGETFKAINQGIHVDFHGVWVDPDDSDHLLAVCDGGVNETFDRGASWQVHRGFSAAQYYDAVADDSVPYNVIGGLQDNGTWVVPSRTRFRDGIGTADCFTIYGGDGFGAQTDPAEPWIVYATSQNGALGVVDLRSGGQTRISRERLGDGQTARFNWDAPFVLSPHNRLTLYHAGNFVWRGERHAHLDNRSARPGQGPVRGDGLRMRKVSPPLGRTPEGTAVALAESPRVQSLIYVGTDDGALWRTDDGGANWQRLEQNLPLPGPRYVSDLVPSCFADDRVYLTVDGHRSDDFATYVFVSNDRGASWRDLGLTLPSLEPCYAIMEDPRNEDLLYLGTEYGAHVSFDRGERWLPLGADLPTVAVRDLFVQDRDSDLIAATHGRGVFVLDVEAVRQVTAGIARKPAHLFAVEPAILWRLQSRGWQGQKNWHAKNPPYGATFHVWLAEPPPDKPALTVHDVTGAEIARVEGMAMAGLQAIQWDARVGRNQLATPGTYAVRWQGRKDVEARTFRLLPDPALAAGDVDDAAGAKE